MIEKKLTPSAVLVPLFCCQGQVHILFTKRTENLNSHKGQVCFPGGVRQPDDPDLLYAALREAGEEIGLQAEDVDVLGELDDALTLSTGYLISPFVAFIPYPYNFEANEKEVEEIFSVPLSAFLEDKAHFKQDYQASGGIGPVYTYEYERHVIWGATARILTRFVELLRESDIEGKKL